MGDYDAVWKEALEVYFPEFLRLLFPDIHAQIDWGHKPMFRDKELQPLDPRSEIGSLSVDKLVEVREMNGSNIAVFVHIEVQGQQQPEFAQRMFVYHSRIIDRYDGEVVSLAVLTDSNPAWRPTTFEYSRWGCRLSLQFSIAKLLDFRDQKKDLERSDNPSAVVVLAQLEVIETDKNDPKRKEWKLAIVRRIYDRKGSIADIRDALRFVDGLVSLSDELDEEFLAGVSQIEEEKEMAIVTSFERAGIRKGREQGIKKGELSMARQNILEALEIRFDSVPPEIRDAVNVLSSTRVCKELHRAAIQSDSIESFKINLEETRESESAE